jgi:2-(3-amino-3-carboxypropyl)histidine synthase
MYVFVDIGVDVRHLVATVRANFPAGTHLALAGTIQFGSSMQVRPLKRSAWPVPCSAALKTVLLRRA